MTLATETRTTFDDANPYGLSELETRVVDLLTAGLTAPEVADLIGLDRRAIATHRAAAMRKYGARNGLHLAHLVETTRRRVAADAGLVVLEDVPTSLSF